MKSFHTKLKEILLSAVTFARQTHPFMRMMHGNDNNKHVSAFIDVLKRLDKIYGLMSTVFMHVCSLMFLSFQSKHFVYRLSELQ